MTKPVVLIIMDGWGLAPPGPGNAISLSALKHIPSYWHRYPHTELAASGEAVGLPPGEDGNTETGHINIGAGRVVYQDLPRINMAIADGNFFKNDAFLGAVQYVTEHHSNLHLLGLATDAGVHASLEHLYALLTLAKRHTLNGRLFLHLFTDGRDSFPNAAPRYLREIEARCRLTGIGTIATIMGRYYAMDRDQRWDRTRKAYEALTEHAPYQEKDAVAAVEASYKRGQTDEFVEPTILTDADGKPYPRIADSDAVIFYNYRIDRPRQLTRAFVLPDFESHNKPIAFDPYAVKYFHKHVPDLGAAKKPFARHVILKNLFFVTMTEYERDLPCAVAFPPNPVYMNIGRVIADRNLRQLRVAETEKERFVTYYFNGMREDPYSGEERLIIPSPSVATYDLKPEMSAAETTARLIDRLSTGVYAFAVINYANPDMVGHTGNIPAAVRACQETDRCVGLLVSSVLARGGACVITGDHGNVEEMLGPGGEMDTEHSTFPVPFLFIASMFEGYPYVLPFGKLADIAPTILSYMHIAVPDEMTGRNLLADVAVKGGNV
ncbi:2,3-bisphosphoglycerate-independent phosphoglycerate mutase [Patescibacteria group bacterium]|nr:2,3-bisphosphoglycerate-independent phosphoglycerate mutase [Patescibacteria group bacterium]